MRQTCGQLFPCGTGGNMNIALHFLPPYGTSVTKAHSASKSVGVISLFFFAATISSQTTSFDTTSVRRAAGRGHCKNSNELCVAATRPSEARAKLYASEWRTWGGDVTRCSPLCVQGRTLPNNNKSRLHCPRRQRRADIFFRRPPSALEIPKSTPPRCYIDGDETIARLVECVCVRERVALLRESCWIHYSPRY
jgi:hypothetical protein